MSDSNIHYVDDLISLPVLLAKIKSYFVSKTQKINGHALSGDITLTPQDIQACSITRRTVTLTSGGWSSKQQQVTCEGVTGSNVVIVSPEPSSYLNWHKYKVRCSGQTNDGKLTFTTDGAPPQLTASVLIIDNTLPLPVGT